ncbi:MAG: type IX secretion system periplasmic lipoprotein PorW/SprE [Bacteroidia bacterium]
MHTLRVWAKCTLSFSLMGCGAERQNVVARSYHTFVSYFNGYYHAEKKFREAQDKIEQSMPLPSEGWLPIYIKVDPTHAKPSYTLLEEAAKKCEVIIFRHKNGNYVDDSRALIGRTWVYRGNLVNARMNFDYVLLAFPRTPLRASIYWWQAYSALQEDNLYGAENALAKADQLSEKEFPKKWHPAYDALRAQMYAQKGEISLALHFLSRSVHKLRPRYLRARGYYFLGQLYAAQEKRKEAYQAFQKVYRMNVSNGLTFQAQFQKTLLGVAGSDVSLKELQKMARQKRYEEYWDHLYYRMGELYLSRKDYPSALEAFLAAGRQKQAAVPVMRSLGYYQAGILYFEHFGSLDRAQEVFDTAATLIPESHLRAKEIKLLAGRFKQYALRKKQIATLDSLLSLARLSPEAQRAHVESHIQAEIQKRRQQKTTPSIVNPNLQPNPFFMQNQAGAGFYFDNPMLVENGKREFVRLWGERKDEDHWRRKNKQAVFSSASSSKDPFADLENLTPEKLEKLRDSYLAQIPKTPQQIANVEDSLIEAALHLRQIYFEVFQKPDSAYALDKWLIKRFPQRLKAVLPAAYGLATSNLPEAPTYRALILEKYPDSEYARLLRGEKKVAPSTGFDKAYATLLEAYNNNEYPTVIGFGEYLVSRFAELDQVVYVYYLVAAAYTHQQEYDSALKYLDIMEKRFSKSSLAPQAKKLRQLIQGARKGKEPAPSPIASSNSLVQQKPSEPNLQGFSAHLKSNEVALVVFLVPQENISSDELKQRLRKFHEQYFAGQGLNLSVFLYERIYHLAYISQFPDYRTADVYTQALERESWVRELVAEPSRAIFFISQSNFRVAFTQRRLEDYAEYYMRNRMEMLR